VQVAQASDCPCRSCSSANAPTKWSKAQALTTSACVGEGAGTVSPTVDTSASWPAAVDLGRPKTELRQVATVTLLKEASFELFIARFGAPSSSGASGEEPGGSPWVDLGGEKGVKVLSSDDDARSESERRRAALQGSALGAALFGRIRRPRPALLLMNTLSWLLRPWRRPGLRARGLPTCCNSATHLVASRVVALAFKFNSDTF
jgi:hypothetical protein